MNIQTRPFLIAAGLGALVQIMLGLLGTLISYALQANLVIDPATNTFSGVNDSAILASSGLSLALCCCVLVVDFGIGAGYAYLHRKTATLDVQDGLVGGALSGTAARLVSGLVGACTTLLLLPTVFTGVGTEGAAAGAAAFGLAFGSVGAIVGICVGLVAGLILGGAGGAVAAALLDRGNA